MDLLFRDDAYLTECEARVLAATPQGIRLDRTVFYPEGGGQPGDTGVLRRADGTALRIVDTRKGDSHEESVLIPEQGAVLPTEGETVTAALDWDRRYAHMRMHTCMHLLCSLVEGDVTGGQVGAEKSRLDFNLPGGSPDKAWLTEELNRLIEEDHAVEPVWIDDAELESKPELVRTMSVKPPSGAGRVRLLKIGEGVDLQPCGGTHVRHTGEIGPVEVAKIENKGKQNRRINVRFAAG